MLFFLFLLIILSCSVYIGETVSGRILKNATRRKPGNDPLTDKSIETKVLKIDVLGKYVDFLSV